MKKRYTLLVPAVLCALCATAQQPSTLAPLPLENVKVTDAFWQPRLRTWDTKTINDVLDKLEGKYEPDRDDLIREKKSSGRTRNAFRNFDRVAAGEKKTGAGDGPPWYDGLVYETIRGAADFLVAYPDPKLEQKLDAYIDRIVAAQAADPDGYINTYTTLDRPEKRWGSNGGDDRWQHDVYNAGMLVEAGIHYYKATGKTKLLEAAVKMSNYMCREMGTAPKQFIIPAHAGPEESLLKLYQLFQQEPGLAQKLKTPVQAADYHRLVKFWIEQRGIYSNADSTWRRNTYGSYNQDHQPVFEQQTIEGHAVRATLLATAVAAMASNDHDERYANTAHHYWNNMIGKRLFITGGQGAIPEDEKFGPDYYLPESAYLETCASIGSGFFSQRMNELEANGKYIDELERVLYNNMLSSVAQDGTHYLYENPLTADKHPRWAWHSCPCCPPMFLKMTGALPGFIYGQNQQGLYVNLFIGSEAQATVGNNKINIRQQTRYPWNGDIQLTVTPARSETFTVYVRIPGWATGKENPFDLYTSSTSGRYTVKVNGKALETAPVNGYIAINRQWKKGDRISVSLPVQPRLITPASDIKTLTGKIAIAAGPLVYAVEAADNQAPAECSITPGTALKVNYQPEIAGGVNVITGSNGIKAIPFYAIGNRGVYAYKVWLKKE